MEGAVHVLYIYIERIRKDSGARDACPWQIQGAFKHHMHAFFMEYGSDSLQKLELQEAFAA